MAKQVVLRKLTLQLPVPTHFLTRVWTLQFLQTRARVKCFYWTYSKYYITKCHTGELSSYLGLGSKCRVITHLVLDWTFTHFDFHRVPTYTDRFVSGCLRAWTYPVRLAISCADWPRATPPFLTFDRLQLKSKRKRHTSQSVLVVINAFYNTKQFTKSCAF